MRHKASETEINKEKGGDTMSTYSKMNGTVIIPEALKQFQDEWVGFEVLEVDERNRAYKGRLIAHSPKREKVWAAVNKLNPPHAFVRFTGDIPPKGMKVLI